MKDERKTKAELIRELRELRARHAESASPTPAGDAGDIGSVPREKMLELLFSAISEGVVMISAEGRMVEANPAAQRIIGLTRAEMMQYGYDQPVLETFDAKGNSLPTERMAGPRAAKEKRPIRDVEIGVQKRDGSTVWLKSSAEPLLNDSGGVDGVVATIVDITKHHEASQALRQSEERFRAQFRGIPIPTYVWRKKGGDLVLTDCNAAAEEITQGGIKDYIGISASEMYAEAPEIIEELHRCVTEEVPIERTLPYTFRSTGESKVLACKYTFVPPDTAMVHTDDITDRVRAEERLRESEEKLRSILSSMDDLVFVLDKNSVFVSFHQPAHEKRLFQPSHKFVGKAIEEVLPPHVASMGRKAILDLLATGETQQFDYPLNAGDEERWYSAKVSARKRNGEEFGGVTVVSRDITKRTRALQAVEEARETLESRVEERTRELDRLRVQAEEVAAMRERERLARDLHDAVTQTLFSISLIADALPAVWDRDPREGRLRVEELRAMSRGALSEMRSLLVEMRSSTLVDGRLDDLLHQLAEALGGATGLEIAVTVEGEGEVPDRIKVGLYRITQEALNNVAKHAAADLASVRLRFLPGRVELTIQDEGEGFDLGKISPGSMGLVIMRERAEAMDAQLTVDSRAGQGTQVKVEWKKREETER